jgi:hypothetical protein
MDYLYFDHIHWGILIPLTIYFILGLAIYQINKETRMPEDKRQQLKKMFKKKRH